MMPVLGASDDAVDPAQYDARISTIEQMLSSTDPEDPTQTERRQLLQAALENVQDAQRSLQLIGDYEADAASAPEQIKTFEARLAAMENHPRSAASLAGHVPLARLEQELRDNRQELEVLRAREALLENKKSELMNRSQLVHDELLEVQSALRSAGDQHGTAASAAVTSASEWLAESTRWKQTALVRRLAVEEQTLPIRLEAVETELALVARQREGVDAFVAELLNLDTVKAVNEAQQLLAEVQDHGEQLRTDLSFIADIAAHNIELGEELLRVTSRTEELEQLLNSARTKLDDLRRDYIDTTQQLAVEELRSSLGPLLKENYLALLEADATENRIADAVRLTGTAQLRSVVVARDLANAPRKRESIYQKIERRDFVDASERQAALASADRVLSDSQRLLTDLSVLYRRVSDGLLALDQVWKEQLKTRAEYRLTLQSTLLWMRSDAPLMPMDVLRWPMDAAGLFAALDWQQFLTDLASPGLTQLALLVAIVVLLFGWRRYLTLVPGLLQRNSLRAVGWERYRYWMTLRSLGLHTIAILPLPVAIFLIGRVIGSAGSTTVGMAFEQASVPLALQAYVLMLFRAMLDESGFARDHLRWQATGARRLQRVLRAAIWLLLPAMYLSSVLGYLTPFNPDSQAHRVASMVVALIATWLLYRGTRVSQGMFSNVFFKHRFEGVDLAGGWLLKALLVLQPLVLLIDLIGYRFTAEVLQGRIFLSLLLIAGTKLLIDTAMLGLAIFRRPAPDDEGSAAAQAGEDDDPRFDLEQMNHSVVMLIHVALLASALTLALLIWQPFIEALTVLDNIDLWSSVSEIDGETVVSAITLLDLGSALLLLAATLVLSRGVPALIGIVLYNVVTQKGALYAIQTVIRYSILAIGVFVMLQLLGFGWSKLQWMAAGLSVGLGFGLQEIFANFFAGLIMLFERPVRIGDVVTLGEFSGTIQRIRMRATTILDFDNREVIVPNKMFVTERLTNWTLSSGVVRLSFVVGLSYEADVRLAHQTLLDLMNGDERIVDEPKPMVVFWEFGDSTLNFRCYCHVKDTSMRLDLLNDLHMRITETFRERGIEIAYPQMDLHVRSVADGIALAFAVKA